MSTYLIKDLVNKIAKLGDRLHLNREQALTALEGQVIPAIFAAQKAEPLSGIADQALFIIIDVLKLLYNSSRWEDRYGAINGSIVLVKHFYFKGEDGQINTTLKDFVWNTIRAEKIPQLLLDKEFRVRNQLGPLLKEMIGHDQDKGVQHFEKLQDLLLKNIEDTFTREPEGGVDASADQSLISKKKINPDSSNGKTMHDTEGWKSLETSMRILQNIIEAVGTRLYDFSLDRILKNILKGVDHINRFVREISYFVLNAIFAASKEIIQGGNELEVKFRQSCNDLIPIIGQGLGDNWSQVRYAASQAARSYYTIAKDDEELRTKYDPLLVPRMCLNRYYVAEGVKIYSIDTWKFVHGSEGKQIICKYAEEVCKFYIMQSTADNHAVREAACHCISELCTKVAREVDKAPFKPYISPMITALLDCFKDESWPVRDCACIACGHFVSTFPEESAAVFDELTALWFGHLSDNIQSVREHSAQSILEVLKHADMYKEQLTTKIKSTIIEDIQKAKEQTSESTKNSGLQNETQFGVAKPNVVDDHNDNQLFSCGSLAPKLKRGGGCMDHGFQRSKELWELSDGAIFLLREATQIDGMHDFAISHLENLANLAYIDHFKHSSVLRENLFKSMKTIVKNLGKKKFRGHVELFLDPAFRNAKKQDQQNMAIAAQEFIVDLEQTYGENIFKAILESHDDRYINDLKQYKEAGLRAANMDFVYPPREGAFAGKMGIGSGQGPVAGLLGVGPGMMTKAPWAK